jgi:hypothetical protein
MQRAFRALPAASAAAIVFLALSGCAAASQTASTGKSSPAHSAAQTTAPKQTPTPSGPAPLPANALFSISAKVTASNGATAHLVQTVFEPVSQDASDVALMNAQCNLSGQPTWQTTYPGSLFLDTTITATLAPGSPAFLPADAINFGFASGASAFSGAYTGFEAPCAPGYIGIPGTIHGVATVPASDPVHGTYGWANNPSSYGFVGGGNDPGGADSGGTAVVSDCIVQLSATAAAADVTEAAWASQPFVMAHGCKYSA